MRTWLGVAAVAVVAAAAPAHASLKPRVMVLPAGDAGGGGAIPEDLARALTQGARRVTPDVARSSASLADTAVIVGCDPAARPCLDTVAAALNVDQLLVVRVVAGAAADAGGEVTVELTAVGRETAPVTQRFPLRPATRTRDLAAIEAAVPAMLEAHVAPGPGADDPGGAGGAGGADAGAGGAGAGDLGPGDAGAGGAGAGSAGAGAGPEVSTRSRRTPAAIALTGGAVVAIGVGAWVLAAIEQGEIDDAPTATAADLDRLARLERTAERYASAGNALVIAGGVAAAAGAVWWWTAGRGRDRAPDDRGLVVTPRLAPTGAGVVVEGRW